MGRPEWKRVETTLTGSNSDRVYVDCPADEVAAKIRQRVTPKVSAAAKEFGRMAFTRQAKDEDVDARPNRERRHIGEFSW